MQVVKLTRLQWVECFTCKKEISQCELKCARYEKHMEAVYFSHFWVVSRRCIALFSLGGGGDCAPPASLPLSLATPL